MTFSPPVWISESTDRFERWAMDQAGDANVKADFMIQAWLRTVRDRRKRSTTCSSPWAPAFLILEQLVWPLAWEQLSAGRSQDAAF